MSVVLFTLITSPISRPESERSTTMAVLDFAGTQRTVRRGISLVEISPTLSRITRVTGEVLGYVEIVGSGRDRAFSARRLISDGRGMLPLGEFWTMDDALDCFRL